MIYNSYVFCKTFYNNSKDDKLTSHLKFSIALMNYMSSSKTCDPVKKADNSFISHYNGKHQRILDHVPLANSNKKYKRCAYCTLKNKQNQKANISRKVRSVNTLYYCATCNISLCFKKIATENIMNLKIKIKI